MSGWFDEGIEEDSGGPADAGANDEFEAEDRARERARAEDRFERYRVKGDDLLSRVKQIVHEGNVRKITIRNDEDRVLLSFPLSAGVIGAALLPLWAAIGAVAALVGNCSIEVERRE